MNIGRSKFCAHHPPGKEEPMNVLIKGITIKTQFKKMQQPAGSQHSCKPKPGRVRIDNCPDKKSWQQKKEHAETSYKEDELGNSLAHGKTCFQEELVTVKAGADCTVFHLL